MKERKLNQKTKKIIIISVLFLFLFFSVFFFTKSLKKDYKTYYETTTIYKGINKIDSDGDISIIIKTEEGNFRISNIVSNYNLYNIIKSTFIDGDEIIIYYYNNYSVLGISKGNLIVLDVEYSTNKLEKNDKLSIIILPIIIVILIISIIYNLFSKTKEDTILPVESTLKYVNTENETVIRLKIPKSLLIIHICVVLSSFFFIPFLIKINIWHVYLLFGLLSMYNLYRLIGLFIRKIIINKVKCEIIFFTPIKKKININLIENIKTIVHEDHEGIDRYFVKIKILKKIRDIKFETVSNEQSIAIKSLLEENNNNKYDAK